MYRQIHEHRGEGEDAADRPQPVAIIGAGPAGLACAWHLALAGVRAVVFDREADAAGVVANVIPRFRISRADIASDLDRIRALGVEFRLGRQVDDPAALAAEGFREVFLATGAQLPRRLELAGNGVKRLDALDFLRQCAADPETFRGLRQVLVAGGGNTAMDACRAALALPGVAGVRLAYRRTRAEMPADREELENCLAEGAALMELTLPEALVPGGVILRSMVLGEPDAGGRRSPRPSGQTSTVACDLLVEAIGELPDSALLGRFGVAVGADGRPRLDPATLSAGRPGLWVGGDAARGPASIIAAAADGRRVARAILAARGHAPHADGPAGGPEPIQAAPPGWARLARRGRLTPAPDHRDPDFAATEAERCLECDRSCLRCVEVCPNRANIALPAVAADGFAQAWQILHIDRLCNECGNCGLFCPWEGEPYRGKPALFADRPALEAAANAGFCLAGQAPAPDLVLRAEPAGPVLVLPWSAWQASAARAETAGAPVRAGLEGLARLVWRDHRYLLAPDAAVGGAS